MGDRIAVIICSIFKGKNMPTYVELMAQIEALQK
jgi:hypothetical protein